MKEFRFSVTANERQDKKEYLETAKTYMNGFWEMMDTCLSVRRPDISVKGLRLKDGILAVRAECRAHWTGTRSGCWYAGHWPLRTACTTHR